jgi:phosphate transport system permease protein
MPRHAGHWREGAVAAIVWTTALGVTGGLGWLLADVVVRGAASISWSFLLETPRDAGRAGGIAPILASTGLILLVCLVVAVPLGVGTATLLAEFTATDRWLGRTVRRSLDVLAGVPSIVFGLFGNAVFCVALGMGYSILAGGLTLACMVLPILIRSSEEGLRAVPDEHRRAAAALGLSRSTTLFRVLLPVAAPGIAVGLVLGIGRALAETAALLFTAGSVDRAPGSLFDSGRSLSVHVYTMAMDVAGGEPSAYGAALVLVVLLLVINAVVSLAAGRTRAGARA